MQVIVMLGAKVLPGGVPSGALLARVERAVELFREGRGEVIVFSGGGEPAEAHVARALAMRAGVPERACVCEDQSRDTAENAAFTAAKLRELGATRVLLVTDPFHMFRPQRHFWRLGIDAVAAPTRWEERGLGRREHLWWTLREIPALLRTPSLFFIRRPQSGSR
jgi:uncharacterized SAM-binding protein YcdF (DUF218 family)